MENFRYWDIMRWKRASVSKKPFEGLYFPGVGSYDLNSDGTDDVCIWSGTKPDTKIPVVYELGVDVKLSEGDHGYIRIRRSQPRAHLERRAGLPLSHPD